MDYDLYKMLNQIIVRQNAMIEMMSGLCKAYAKINNLATEEVIEECEDIDTKRISK